MESDFEQFAAQLFAAFPPTPEREQARAETVRRLHSLAAAQQARGLDEAAAARYALICFGARAGAREALSRCRLRARRSRFRRRYPHLVRAGAAALFLLPPLAALLWGDVEHKVETLVLWTALVIAAVAFLIAVEYLDYYFQKQEEREELEP